MNSTMPPPPPPPLRQQQQIPELNLSQPVSQPFQQLPERKGSIAGKTAETPLPSISTKQHRHQKSVSFASEVLLLGEGGDSRRGPLSNSDDSLLRRKRSIKWKDLSEQQEGAVLVEEPKVR